VIITHGEFRDSLGPLVEFREAQGLSVALIDMEDVYDEFSFGHRGGPQAIKDFINRAKGHWRTPPRFVLLAGDASLDPRDYLGMGDYDLVPTKTLSTEFIETASDDWFVDANDDGLPELAIGRLPVRSVEEADLVVSKILDYEQSAKAGEGLMVADQNDEEYNFEAMTVQIEAQVPEDIYLEEIFRGQNPSAKTDLMDRLNQGQLLVNYMGHGSAETWKGDLLTSSDARSLTNSPNLSFFVNMTCLNGFFHDVFTECLAEALIKAEQGGAVAVWASSGLTSAGGQAMLNQEIYRLLFNGEGLSVGEATMGAKRAVSDMDVKRTWILFGDPTTRLE
jgi:hypothetical protein